MDSIEELQEIAKEVRRDVVEMVYRAGSGHLAGSLSVTDILVALWFGGIIEKKVEKVEQVEQVEKGDRFILSAGHYCPALYSVLSRLGYFDRKLLWTLRELDSPLQGHPHRGNLPGIELSTGALGQGLSVGVGKALAIKVQSSKFKVQNNKNACVFVLMSDGEQNEGQVWEAAMTAAKYKLDNLVAIIDKNGIQSAGNTLEVMPLEDLQEKYEAFGWEVTVVDGHQIGEMIRVMREMRGMRDDKQSLICLRQNKGKGKPKVVVAKTVAGKGVSFLERDFRWHAKPIGEEEYKKALEELA